MTLTITQGNITYAETDAIVNAANDRLAEGGGVCGAIFDAVEAPISSNILFLHANIPISKFELFIPSKKNELFGKYFHIGTVDAIKMTEDNL